MITRSRETVRVKMKNGTCVNVMDLTAGELLEFRELQKDGCLPSEVPLSALDDDGKLFEFDFSDIEEILSE